MGARKRRRRSSDGLTLNMAAMLDMAFQLLAFFVATFKPMTLEQQIALRLPAPSAAVDTEPPTIRPQNGWVIACPLNAPLRVELVAKDDGSLDAVSLLHDGRLIRDLNEFEAAAQKTLGNCASSTPTDEILLEVDPRLELQATLAVMERCLKLKSSDGKPVTKITPIPVGKK
jgi:biopolymer transport protein ExbD